MRLHPRRTNVQRNAKAQRAGKLRRAHAIELLENRTLLSINTPVSSLHNTAVPYDVNRDGRVTPLDALMVINYLQSETRGSSGPTATPAATTGTGSTASTSPSLGALDTNGDGRITPLDALNVINVLDASDDMFIHTFATDLAGNPISQISENTPFFVETDVQDVAQSAGCQSWHVLGL